MQKALCRNNDEKPPILKPICAKPTFVLRPTPSCLWDAGGDGEFDPLGEETTA